ncbi:phosphoethanolamine transferase [Helicobacter pametensis]|uniref:phosphoethanolamine transferase n=2 Tax=Helicobacter pametensis TaxID=95149 RepID=UPI0004BCCB63|nr:phosphoethanolamine transferase [Helicobacter pametensis]
MKDRSFFIQAFLYVSFLFFLVYGLTSIGKNFSISIFVAKLVGWAMLATLFYVCYGAKKAGYIMCYIILLISTLCFVIDLCCLWIFETPLSGAMVATLLETNPSEAMSFFELYGAKIIWAICVSLVGIGVGFLVFKKVHLPFVGLKILAFLGIFAWIYEIYLLVPNFASCQYRNTFTFMTPMRQGCEFYRALHELQEAQKALKEYQKLFAFKTVSATSLTSTEKIKNLVLILGESTQRGYMQIYGFFDPTTPLLSTFEINKNLFVFSDVISPHAQTTLSLKNVLTFSNVENSEKPWYLQENLVSLFRQYGYWVTWVSNQLNVTHGGPIGAIASLSQEAHFVSEYKRNFDEVFYDGRLLEFAKPDSKKAFQFFVFHLMGAHASYGNRYPQSFAYFNDRTFNLRDRTIARYKNAVLYNDYVVSEIFKSFSSSDSLVIYLADHGEEVYDYRDFVGHSDDKISRFMVEIPFMIYVSDLFIQKHPELYQRIKKAINRPYMTDDLIHTILDIAGIKTQDFNPTRSIINDAFNASRKRIVGGAQGKDYDKELKNQKALYH